MEYTIGKQVWVPRSNGGRTLGEVGVIHTVEQRVYVFWFESVPVGDAAALSAAAKGMCVEHTTKQVGKWVPMSTLDTANA